MPKCNKASKALPRAMRYIAKMVKLAFSINFIIAEMAIKPEMNEKNMPVSTSIPSCVLADFSRSIPINAPAPLMATMASNKEYLAASLRL